jgi:hypothetical protein
MILASRKGMGWLRRHVGPAVLLSMIGPYVMHMHDPVNHHWHGMSVPLVVQGM